MGTCIVKVVRDPDDDRYLVWSTIVDNFTYLGTKREIVEDMLEQYGRMGVGDLDRRFEQCDRLGSDSYLRRWVWEQEKHLVTNVPHHVGWYWLRRDRLGEWYDRLEAWATGPRDEPEPDLIDLLEPVDDDEDED